MKKTLQQIIREDFNKSYKCNLKAEDVIAKTDYFKKSTVVESKAMICSDDSANLEDSLSVGTSLQEERPINSTKLITCKEELDDEVSNEEETEQCEIKKPSNKFLFYQRAFRSTAIFAATLIIVISILTINVTMLNDEKKFWNDKIDSQFKDNSLSDSELKYMQKNTDKIYENAIFEVMINDHTKLKIYKGTSYINHEKSNKIYFYKIVDSHEDICGLTLECNNKIINVTSDNVFGILTVIISNNSTMYDSFVVVASYGSTSIKYQVSVPTSL